ncbi:hypothetical protein DTO164E3_4203 [Paecilomyces variotii]|uniref:DUF7918 domain-containing protein n=1 Tax=Byssochlamys spectabilis TaxID=264951 RepID=A0A443HWZ7_BYSSP|nr:hypothetical protein C8Q69DRAFT_241426 [Paecilomyces variotii]KAJ9196962.1 hypothetical protein DTO032I3_6202 [Paecilomyces variotii]KAJ9200192.1 hypothetical protein DTO164E3_4203 [Paecilomyces variotii]KAJ9226712.1 hypothetical protein DTO169C6_952 [Paecilomyces variotii]KAJ9267737.1 hypothetical protein DTO195F2_71 [Paecilomyces variotii]KAJ9281872.1 hypothetical protein DTO021D3_1168 [Paecilomyces variotii]
MPCFKGLAVSIHTPEGPLPEHSVQRQSRASRIACYIPVPPPKISDAGKAEQSTFAISITLLNPGQNVPYSTPKPTPDNPSPKPKVVGGLPGQTAERGKYGPIIGPYQPLTNSPNETVAAYIYFDGRQKEEVATLLRRGEETWVNSRWVSVPESEGGGLAEREFLFREVGLERWLNGLDLEGKDAAAKIERRRQKIERHRQKKKAESDAEGNGEMEMDGKSTADGKGVMRYGNNDKSPLEGLSDDDMSSLSGSDDDPIPETTGQIKVALFRVLASGEIKRGEYSPQFDAHDDDDDSQGGQGGGADADIDHTTSFAKPKTLDPKTISTQTVTGIDPTDKPYAIFTFMYRGERQLQKMGILKDPKSQDTPGSTKRRSLQPDFSNLGPLKPGGTVGFLNFRDKDANKGKRKSKKSSASDMDSDDDDDDDLIIHKAEDEEAKDADVELTAEELRRQGELAEGVRKIKLKRQHSSEAVGGEGDATNSNTPAAGSTPPVSTTPPNASGIPSGLAETKKSAVDSLDSAFVGSPLKKQRASVSGADEDGLLKRMGSGLTSNIGEVLGSSKVSDGGANPSATSAFGGSLGQPQPTQQPKQEEDEEEL